MVFTKHKMFAPAVLTTCLLVFSASPVLAQDTTNPAGSRTVASGQKMKLKGVVTRRDADTFTVRDMNGVDTVVRLDDRTSVKTKGGFLRSGTNYAQTSILRGLNLEVEGRGNASGELLAEKVRFNESDMRVARAVESRAAPRWTAVMPGMEALVVRPKAHEHGRGGVDGRRKRTLRGNCAHVLDRHRAVVGFGRAATDGCRPVRSVGGKRRPFLAEQVEAGQAQDLSRHVFFFQVEGRCRPRGTTPLGGYVEMAALLRKSCRHQFATRRCERWLSRSGRLGQLHRSRPTIGTTGRAP